MDWRNRINNQGQKKSHKQPRGCLLSNTGSNPQGDSMAFGRSKSGGSSGAARLKGRGSFTQHGEPTPRTNPRRGRPFGLFYPNLALRGEVGCGRLDLTCRGGILDRLAQHIFLGRAAHRARYPIAVARGLKNPGPSTYWIFLISSISDFGTAFSFFW